MSIALTSRTLDAGTVAHPVRRPLHVVHVVLSMDVGGAERNVLNQVREGRRLGQTVSIVCLERRGTLAAAAEELGATLVCLAKPPGLRISTIVQLRRVLRDLRPAIVHTHQVGTLFYAGWAALGRLDVRVVHTAHGREAYAERRRVRWLGRCGAVRAARFYCLTDDIASEVLGR